MLIVLSLISLIIACIIGTFYARSIVYYEDAFEISNYIELAFVVICSFCVIMFLLSVFSGL